MKVNEFAIDTLIRQTGAARQAALAAYRTASGDFSLARKFLCQEFKDNETRLFLLRREAEKAAYRREQATYSAQVDALKKKRRETKSAATLRARVLAFQIRVAIDAVANPNDFPYEDYKIEPVGRLAERLCNA